MTYDQSAKWCGGNPTRGTGPSHCRAHPAEVVSAFIHKPDGRRPDRRGIRYRSIQNALTESWSYWRVNTREGCGNLQFVMILSVLLTAAQVRFIHCHLAFGLPLQKCPTIRIPR